MDWLTWIRQHWQELLQGKKLFVQQELVGHPRCYPRLFEVGQGWPDGQSCDYMIRLEDRSRIHVQCFIASDGTRMLRVHRDRWDPDRGPIEFVLHGLFETPVGLAMGLAGIVLLISR